MFWLPFKPQGYKDEFHKMSDEQIQLMNSVDHLVGWTVVAGAAAFFLLRNK
jgi:hypothetical protein